MGATKKDRRINTVLSVLFTILCIAWMYPVFMILMNSLKTERAITTTHAFELPNAETFVGLKNYIYGIQEMDFLSSFWYSLVITVSSVALIFAVLLHVRMVYHPRAEHLVQGYVLSVRIQHDRSLPDGHVHTGKNR